MPVEPPRRRAAERRTERKSNAPQITTTISYNELPELSRLDRRKQNWVEGELQKGQRFEKNKDDYIRRKLNKILDYFNVEDREQLSRILEYYKKEGKEDQLIKILNDLKARSKINKDILDELIEIVMLNANKISEAHKVRARDLAERDEATKLYVTPKFKSLVEMYMREQPKGTFFFIDVNNLKKINDRADHVIGDLYLETLADSMSEIAKKHGLTIARIGGDEFGMYLASEPDPKTRNAIIQELRVLFEKKWAAEDTIKIPASFAVGYATKSEIQRITRKQNIDYETISSFADNRMKADKKAMKATRI